MNELTCRELESIVLFLRERAELFSCHCQLHDTTSEDIVRKLAQEHARKVGEL